MKFFKTIPPWLAYTALFAILVLALVTILTSYPSLTNTEPAEPPVPVYDDLDYVVKVANQSERGLFTGYGVKVDYKGVKFILTSRMLLMEEGEVTVNGLMARVTAVNLTSDLVALQDITPGPKPCYIKLRQVWRPESSILVTHTQTLVTVKDSGLRDEWIGLDHAPVGSEGAPLFQDGDLVGLFLGFSKKGTPIAANNDALNQFGEQILEESK